MVQLYQESIAGPGVEPAHSTGAQIPMQLANESHSGMSEFGSQLAFQGEKQMDRYIQIKTANEVSSFNGEVQQHQNDYRTFLASNPNASMAQMEQAKGVMMDRIGQSQGNMTLGTSKRYASNWYLQNRGAISSGADFTMARIGTQNEYNKTLAGINAMTANGDFNGVVDLARTASGQQNFEVRNTPTQLSESEEVKFQEAYTAYSGAQGGKISSNPDDPRHFYDYRGLFKGTGAITPDSQGHLTSKYKMEGHPNMYVDGIHTPSGKKFSGGVLSVEQAGYLIANARNKIATKMVAQAAEDGLGQAIAVARSGEEGSYELAREIIDKTHVASAREGAYDDLDAEMKRQEKRTTAASQGVADTQLQAIRDDALGMLPDGQPPVTMHDLNVLLKKNKELPGTGIDEDQYQELVKALNGENTAFDVSNPRVERQVLDDIKEGKISSDGVRLLHGKGLSTEDIKTLGTQADARLKAGAAVGMNKQLDADLETLKKSGFFIWGQDQDWAEKFGPEDKPEDMSFEDRMGNMATFVALEKNLNQWRIDNPNASDAEKQAYYDRLVDPARVHVAIGAGKRFWNLGSDEQEIRRELQWKNVREKGEALAADMDAAEANAEDSKSKEELQQTKKEILQQMEPEHLEAWQAFEKTGGTWQRWQAQDSLVRRGN